MCIIAMKPIGQQLDHDIMKRCYDQNGDGCGFAYIQNKKIEIVKGKMEFEKLWNQINDIQKNIETPVLVHFRTRTVGEVDEVNCHPFRIDDNNVMAHNGTIIPFSNWKSKFSDTILFLYNVLKPLFKRDPGFLKTDFGQYLLEESISMSRMIILNSDGSYTILNESRYGGRWDNNIWYSKDTYLPPPPPKPKKEKGKNSKTYIYKSLIEIENPKFELSIKKGQLLTAKELNNVCRHYKRVWGAKKCKVKRLRSNKIIERYKGKETEYDGVKVHEIHGPTIKL
jgi:hypothetical protein